MKNYNAKKKSQLFTLGIIIIALMGVLIINSGSATANNNETVKTDQVEKTAATDNGAQSKAGDESPIGQYSSQIMPSMFKLGGALILVIACIYGGLFLLKKSMGKKYSNNRTNSNLEIIETTHIAPKKTLTLVRVADKAVLVGTTENNMSVLTELDETKTAELLAQMEIETEQDNFKDLISIASNKLKNLTGFKQTAPAKV